MEVKRSIMNQHASKSTLFYDKYTNILFKLIFSYLDTPSESKIIKCNIHLYTIIITIIKRKNLCVCL